MENEQTIKKIPKLCFVIVNKLWISHNIFIFGNKIIDFFSKDDRRHEIEFETLLTIGTLVIYFNCYIWSRSLKIILGWIPRNFKMKILILFWNSAYYSLIHGTCDRFWPCYTNSIWYNNLHRHVTSRPWFLLHTGVVDMMYRVMQLTWIWLYLALIEI